jgi:hypothetical protein
MARIVCRTVPVVSIDEATAREMFALFARYFVDVSWERFLADLQEKTWVLLFRREGGGAVAGFSTVLRTTLDAAPGATFLFSGDTVVDPELWRPRLLERSFFWLIAREKLRAPHRRLYWMLISKGYTTYRILARSFPHGFPRRGAGTPPRLQRLLDAFYGARYRGAYDAARGVIAFQERHGALRGGVAESRTRTLEDPDVRFFLARNPGWRDGDELACIAEIRLRDFARYVADAFGQPGRRRRRIATRPVASSERADAPGLAGR